MIEKKSFDHRNIFDDSVEIAVADIFTLFLFDFTLLIEEIELNVDFSPSFENFKAVGKIPFLQPFVGYLDGFAERMKIITDLFRRAALLLFLMLGVTVK